MANRIEFETMVNAAGFRKGMAEMEAAAAATNGRLQNMLRQRISGVQNRMNGMDPNSWEYVQAAQRKATLERSLLTVQNAQFLRMANNRTAISKKELDDQRMIWIAGQAEWRKIQEANTAAMLAGFETQRIAARELAAEQEALLLAGARGQGPGMGGQGAHSSSLTGVIRESLVIMREISMGRGLGRIGGSVTLLAQYFGMLNKVVHSTATVFLEAAEKEGKLYAQMAKTALAAKGTADYDLLKSKALKQLTVATEAQTDAEIALATATVTVKWALIAMIALIIIAAFAVYALYKHFARLTAEKLKFERATDASTKSIIDETEALKENARAHAELQKWLAEEMDNRRSLIDITDESIRKMHEEMEAQKQLMRAKGASAVAINAMEIKELQTEERILEASKAQADADLINAQAALDAADADKTKYAEEHGGDLAAAQTAERNAGETIEKIKEAAATSPALVELNRQKLAGNKTAENGIIDAAKGGYSWDTSANYVLNSTKGMDIDQAIKAAQGMMETIEGVGHFGATIEQATDKAKKNSIIVDRLTKNQDTLNTNLDEQKRKVKDSNDASRNAGKRIEEIKGTLGIKQGIGEQAAAAEDAKKHISGSDSMVKVGNFLGTARSGIEILAQRQLKVAEQSLHHLKSIDGNTGNQHGGMGGGTGYSGT